MWFSSNFIAYLITGLLGSMVFLVFSKLCKKLFCNLSAKKALNSLSIFEITNEKQCQEACANLKLHCQDLSALGFDCEWVSVNGIKRPVALLQLASVHGLCCLFRLNVMGVIPNELQEILHDKDIIKLGVDPLNDSKLLKASYNTQVCSTLDLRHLYQTCRGLGYLSSMVIGVELDKSYKIKCSNWESLELTSAQKEYAAKDAFVSVMIFKKWLSTQSLQNNSNTFNNWTLSEKLKSQLSVFYDVNFKVGNIPPPSEKLKENIQKAEGATINNNLKKLKSNFVMRKVPLYHNCFMLAPDGELLCSCDKRKAEWYIEKGLAEALPGEPYSIRLLFEPAGRTGNSKNGRFYQQLKQNCCVVCGTSESYLRHKVIPNEYRRHFPNEMKSHQSHDIVLMCYKCHFEAAEYNRALKLKLAQLCNAPFKVEITEIKEVQKIKNCAKALLNSGSNIPLYRKIDLENKIKQYHQVDEMTEDLLVKTANLNSKIIGEADTHGVKVVNYFKERKGGLEQLEILWRAHFLNTMKPKYLPALWSVTHNSKVTDLVDENYKSYFFCVSTICK